MRGYFSVKSAVLFILALALTVNFVAAQDTGAQIIKAKKLNATTFELILNNNHHIVIDFYGKNIFRMYQDSIGLQMRPPAAEPDAQILVDAPRKDAGLIKLMKDNNKIIIASSAVELVFDKNNTLFTLKNQNTGKTVVRELTPVEFAPDKTTLTLRARPHEYFYGGGVQNGRFSHKGKKIAIVNENSWTDGGVASPSPFYWSTGGYGFMWFTFKKGHYDFGSQEPGIIKLSHTTDYLDVFFMINNHPRALLNDFYQLTGHPVLLPKFAFYEGHLNAYNRDYWKQDTSGILFEDGKRYVESQKDNGGVKESLNGEKNNYQFSARAVIDRYKSHNMPLGWFLPNDGYGAGYGQASTLDSNVTNLKKFGDYARKNGVELGLWTQSDLHPVPGVKALLQRDIVKEVKIAGTRVLKTDVAWVGAGYSFGLNGIADVAAITTKYGHGARPFIITLDGWAGTQRYAAVWSGDQTGGNWEYIRFHIPTYIGAGLSGLSNITSDMDGIFGGDNLIVNVRDFEWRAFSPMQLNMDGWGATPKYPWILGEPATSINRNYLKLKSELIPYTYSIAHNAIDGLPMIRAMFLDYPNAFTHGTATKYQFMYGPYFLVAPIYQDTQMDSTGRDIRNNIYLPQGRWIDYFSGKQYKGDRVINYYDAPLWKLPVFVKPGAIIPMVNPNNNVSQINKHLRIFELYPHGRSSFTVYNDDGKTVDYKQGKSVSTKVTSILNGKQVATLFIAPAKGGFNSFVKNKATILKFNVSERPKNIKAYVGGKKVRLKKAHSEKDFQTSNNVYYYNAAPEFNRFSTEGSSFAGVSIRRNPQLWIRLAPTDVTKNGVEVEVHGYVFNLPNPFKQSTGTLAPPGHLTVLDSNAAAFALTPSWNTVKHADYYDISFNDMLYTHITDTSFSFAGLQPETSYDFKLRAVNKSGTSDWVSIHAKTKANPLQYAIPNISGYCTMPAQGGHNISKLFDFDSTDQWHTKYGEKAVPFELIIDLRSVNSLDKIQYLPRRTGSNGIITDATVYFSNDKKTWTPAGNISWGKNTATKTFVFKKQPKARFIKFRVAHAVGNYGSGRELYVFKVPGTSSYIPGDINSDGKIDYNDLTSYTNYTGLRRGDGDFEGYISVGDINKNDLIDAFDISNVATRLNSGVRIDSAIVLSGKITLYADKKVYKKGEVIKILVKGSDMSAINALSFALPYNPNIYEYTGLRPLGIKEMKNLTNDRLHSDGEKVLYPTFVNIGDQKTLNGSHGLFILKFRAKKDLTFGLKAVDGIIVSKGLDVATF